jgi:hypothetical protein
MAERYDERDLFQRKIMDFALIAVDDVVRWRVIFFAIDSGP